MLLLGVIRDAYFHGALYRSKTLLMNGLMGMIWFFFFWASGREKCSRRKVDCALCLNSTITDFLNINIPNKGQQIWLTWFKLCTKQRYKEKGLKSTAKNLLRMIITVYLNARKWYFIYYISSVLKHLRINNANIWRTKNWRPSVHALRIYCALTGGGRRLERSWTVNK